MDCNKTRDYLAVKLEMCKYYQPKCAGEIECAYCPFMPENSGYDCNCVDMEADWPDDVIRIAQKWADEHLK